MIYIFYLQSVLWIKNIEIENNKHVQKFYFRIKNSKSNRNPYVEFDDGSIKDIQYIIKLIHQCCLGDYHVVIANFCGTNRKMDITMSD